ncbi:serine/threonine-protein kinase [Nostoc sp. CMAA1605]|uniref:serine/threonine-protein kinase n=1 Tax=Nostoc sp. CMAA1605 TaxID=2055159 RepID=UPI001F30F194|nr:serine/threonine-protein kinase [Nostoc sp. CMAA1605]MCF4968251.1 serine/threonine protein kinase [Nostoc sp. CMAA1605]
MAWASGQKLYGDRYIIEKKLGEGGLGVTYLAKDKKGNRVVIKTLKDEIFSRPNVNWYQEKFFQEAVQLAVFRHANIVRIENVFKQEQLPCIVMDYIEGEDLEKLVLKRGVLSEVEALHYIRQIGEALTVVHEKGLLHRDIKPSNIMVRSANYEAILIDFGLARGFIPDFTQQLTVGLTHGFAPPEQYYQEGRWGEYTDVYALAATLYYLLTKTNPIAAPIRALNAPFKQPKEINSSLSSKVNQAIWQGMALEATKRPPTIQQWLELLSITTHTVQTPLQSTRGMSNDAATLYCPNCQAANPLTNKFCQQCSTPLPQRYLWVVEDVSGVGSPGDLLAGRYLIINPSVVLEGV